MRYRAGWLIPSQILSLTHFDPVVTQEDFMNIAGDTAEALQSVNKEFHLLIDNRIIQNETVASLEMMLQAMPMLNHPQLSWIVMILPETIKNQAKTMPIQENGHIQLKYVDSLESAFKHFRAVDDSITWDAQDRSFFVNE